MNLHTLRRRHSEYVERSIETERVFKGIKSLDL